MPRKTNHGLFATFIIKMEDVSEQILTGVNQNLTEKERQSIISKNISSISGSYKKEPEQDIKVVPFYDGNQYILFVTETYSDVRLVGAPPSSIGKFGSDTDNWDFGQGVLVIFHYLEYMLVKIINQPNTALIMFHMYQNSL